jgi:hypothetical protein
MTTRQLYARQSGFASVEPLKSTSAPRIQRFVLPQRLRNKQKQKESDAIVE